MNQIVTWLSGLAAVLLATPGMVGARFRQQAAELRTKEDGQAVTEYTLVILVAASVALLLLNWVNSGAVAGFFDTIFNQVTGMFAA